MRKFVLTTLFICISALTFAQSGKVVITVLDAQTKEGIPGAVVEFAPTNNPDKAKQYISAYAGKTALPSTRYGEYNISVSFLGYQTKSEQIAITAENRENIVVEISEEATKIDAVVMEVEAIRASSKGDTVSYNAGAFKVANDADVEGLLKKMPGITVKNGSVEAQGETVKKIFVDGKEFFGEDVSTALNSLPAQSVKNIEVFNKLSDNAEFSGMDDGEGYKALNIVTHSHMRQGVFGKLSAGYGYQPETDDITSSHKYTVGGNVNYFTGSSRISVIGHVNNINQQNFSFEDIMGVTGGGGQGGGMGRGVGQYMVRPQSGVANVGSIGLNYSNSWGEKEKVKLQASYFFNRSRTRNLSELIRWYEAPMEEQGTLEERGYSDNRNYNHRLNLRFDWRISENHSIMSRTNVSLQGYTPFSESSGQQIGAEGSGIYDLIDNFSKGNGDGYRASEFLQYRVKLGKPGRLLTVDGHINVRGSDNDSRSHSVEKTDVSTDDEGAIIATPTMRYLSTLSDSKNMGAGGSITYAEPLSKVSQITVRYNVNYSGQESDRKTWNFGTDDTYTNGTIDPKLSNSQTSDYITHSAGPGFRYSKERNTLVVNVNYQYSTLSGNIQSAENQRIKHSYKDFTYFLMGNFNINKQNSIRLFVMSNTNNPRIEQLQNILNISNARNVSRGNENLNPAYSHRVNFHYNHTNLDKGRTFMWMFSFNATQDYISSSIFTKPELINEQLAGEGLDYTPTQYSTYDNVDGYLGLRTHLSYGTPLNFMKCNFNIMAGVNYSRTPSLVNNERNLTSNMGYDASVTLGSNISENVDFTLSWDGTYNQADNSLGGKNDYFYHSASGNLKVVFWKGFTFTASASYIQNIGFTNDYNDTYTLCNAYLGKKLFKNKLGEVMVGVNDIFNQNTSFARSVSSGYTQNTWNSVIGRYFTVKFNYNLRIFGKKGSREITDYGMGMQGGQRGGMQGGMHRMGPGPR